MRARSPPLGGGKLCLRVATWTKTSYPLFFPSTRGLSFPAVTSSVVVNLMRSRRLPSRTDVQGQNMLVGAHRIAHPLTNLEMREHRSPPGRLALRL